ncbi:MAG: tetratricopeptide repeat protein [Pseudohongiella sp.]|nr:tetratricopeptide repeat protein [Pseudohongiella sp.]
MKTQSGFTFRVLGLSLAISMLTAGVTATSAFAQQSGATQQEQALATTNELAQRHYRRANTYNNLERFDEAITEYQLAIAADPNLADAYRNLANIFLSKERFNEAITMLARFIALQSDEQSTPLVASLKTIGELLRRAERFEESIDYDIRAIAADPRDESQIHIMANRYDNAGDSDKAIRIYEQATISIPDNAFMNRNLGRLLEREGRLQDALAQYQRAAETDPSAQYYRELVQNIEARLALGATVAQG